MRQLFEAFVKKIRNKKNHDPSNTMVTEDIRQGIIKNNISYNVVLVNPLMQIYKYFLTNPQLRFVTYEGRENLQCCIHINSI